MSPTSIMSPSNMSSPTRYPEIAVAGSPREMGRQIGEAACELIRGFAAVALERVNLTLRVSRRQATDVANASIAYAADYSPDMMEELQGVSEGAGVSLVDLMILQVRNQFQAEPEAGCTSLSLPARPGTRSGSIVAQNWDNDPGLDPFTVVLVRRPAGKPALMNLTQAGLIAYVGLNDAGIGLCLNTLPAPSRPTGVPHYFTVRGIYESRALDGAVEAVSRAHRAIPANIILSSPQGPADLEVTIDQVHVIRPGADGRVTHTNHCRHPALAAVNDAFPELIQSGSRQERIDSLLERASAPSLADVQAALKDHEGFPRSICRHPNDDRGTGHWQTTFSVIIEPNERRMHVSRGTPCEHPYETYKLS